MATGHRRHGWSTVNICIIVVLVVLMPAMALGVSYSTKTSGAPIEQVQLKYNDFESAEESTAILNDVLDRDPSDGRSLSVSVEGYTSLVNMTLLESLLQRNTSSQVVELHWKMQSPIGKKTLGALGEGNPNARVYYIVVFQSGRIFGVDESGYERTREDPASPGLREALNSPLIYSIKAEIWYGSSADQEKMNLVYDLLTTCHNIRELDLSMEHHGCIVSDYAWAFDFTRDKKPLPPLQHLKVAGYRFEHDADGRFRSHADVSVADHYHFPLSLLPRMLRRLIPWYELPQWMVDTKEWEADRARQREEQYQKERTQGPPNLNAWLKRMDISHLKELDLNYASTSRLLTFAAHLKELESLTVRRGGCDAASDVITLLKSDVGTLRHLALHDVSYGNYSELLNTLGGPTTAFLSSLSIKQHEPSWTPNNAPITNTSCSNGAVSCDTSRLYLNAAALHDLAHRLPHLESLEIDVERFIPVINDSRTWTIDVDAIKAAAKLPNIIHLRVNVESPDSTLVRYRRASTHRSFINRDDRLEKFRQDPTLNLTYVENLFRILNAQRTAAELEELIKLEMVVGLYDYRSIDWGMMGAPDLLTGRLDCTKNARGDHSGTVCSGNVHHDLDDMLYGMDDLSGVEVEDVNITDKFGME